MGVIDHIYDALLDEAAFEALPTVLAASVGARSCTFQVIEGTTPIHVSTSYFVPEMTDYYLEHGMIASDPWNAWGRDNRLFGTVMDSDQYLSRGAFADGAFYNDFFRVFGDDTGICLGALLPTKAGLVGLGLQRALTAEPFGQAENQTARDLLPHLRRMTDARALVRDARTRERDAEAVLDRLTVGAMVVDAGGRVRLANAAARAVLNARDGLCLAQGALTATTAAGAARLSAALAQAGARAGAFGGAIAIGRPSGRRAYRLIVSPHRASAAHVSQALVLIDDPEREPPELAALLSQLFDLTPAEADLAVRLARGATVEEACAARSVLLSTGRSQLKRLLEKTDTRRQGELMALIARLPGVGP